MVRTHNAGRGRGVGAQRTGAVAAAVATRSPPPSRVAEAGKPAAPRVVASSTETAATSKTCCNGTGTVAGRDRNGTQRGSPCGPSRHTGGERRPCARVDSRGVPDGVRGGQEMGARARGGAASCAALATPRAGIVLLTCCAGQGAPPGQRRVSTARLGGGGDGREGGACVSPAAGRSFALSPRPGQGCVAVRASTAAGLEGRIARWSRALLARWAKKPNGHGARWGGRGKGMSPHEAPTMAIRPACRAERGGIRNGRGRTARSPSPSATGRKLAEQKRKKEEKVQGQGKRKRETAPSSPPDTRRHHGRACGRLAAGPPPTRPLIPPGKEAPSHDGSVTTPRQRDSRGASTESTGRSRGEQSTVLYVHIVQ